MKPRIREKGFTLVELLVVVSIISLLSSLIVPSIQAAREKALRSAYSQELEQFRLALEVYRSEKGIYPYENATDPGGTYASMSINFDGTVSGDSLTDFLTVSGLIPKYISKIPLLSRLPGVTSIDFYYVGGPGFGGTEFQFYCDYKTPKGYQLIFYVNGGYDDNEMISLGLKRSTQGAYPGAEVWPGSYCLTGTE